MRPSAFEADEALLLDVRDAGSAYFKMPVA